MNIAHLTLKKISTTKNSHQLSYWTDENIIEAFLVAENSGSCQSLGDAVRQNLANTKINTKNIYADDRHQINIAALEY